MIPAPHESQPIDPQLLAHRHLQIQIAAAIATFGMDFDTNGGPRHRFWNFKINLVANAVGPAVTVPFTFACAESVVTAVIALKKSSPIDDIIAGIAGDLASVAMVKFVPHVEGVDFALLRADLVWPGNVGTPFPGAVFAAMWQSVVAAWMSIEQSHPGRLVPGELDAFPQVHIMGLSHKPPAAVPDAPEGTADPN